MKSEVQDNSGLFEAGSPRADGGQYTRRFYLKPSGKAQVIVLSGENQFRKIVEHEVWVDKKPRYATCCQSPDHNCPLCEAAKGDDKIRAKDVWLGTILNVSGFKKTDGTEVKNVRQVLPLNYKGKEHILPIAMTLREDKNSLQHGLFNVERPSDQKSIKTGQFMFRRMMTNEELAELRKKDVEMDPYDFMEMDEFKPSLERCTALAKAHGGKPSDSYDNTADVPF